jgi:RNA binding exosome subunit
MTNERTLDRLMAHLRTHVTETRRLELEGADQREVEERKRLILRLQQQLAYAVRDLLTVDGKSGPGRALPSS